MFDFLFFYFSTSPQEPRLMRWSNSSNTAILLWLWKKERTKSYYPSTHERGEKERERGTQAKRGVSSKTFKNMTTEGEVAGSSDVRRRLKVCVLGLSNPDYSFDYFVRSSS